MPLIDTPPDAVAAVYAKSLVELAERQGGKPAIEQTLGELEDILELARGDAKFSEFLASRALPDLDRDAALGRIFQGRVSPLTLKFLQTLNKKARLSHLSPIVAAVDAEVQTRFGRVEVDVFTAEPLGSDEIRRIKEQLAGVLRKEVVVHPYVDGQMIGGIKLRIGDQLIDGSVETQLRKLRDQLHTKGTSAMRAKIDRLFE